MTKEILIIIITAITGYIIWLIQGRRTRCRIRYQIFQDIQRIRKKLIIMDKFFERLNEGIKRKEMKRIYYERGSGSLDVYNNLISQLHLLSNHEIDVISSFYDWYKEYDHEIAGISDTLKQWEERSRQGEPPDDKKREIALFNLHRIITMRKLLLKNTEGLPIISFSSDYETPLNTEMDSYRGECGTSINK